jgi:hypothetical protein
MTVCLDCYVDLYELKSSKIMKFDIFSRKKFKCTIYDDKFKTQFELTEHKHMRDATTSDSSCTHPDECFDIEPLRTGIQLPCVVLNYFFIFLGWVSRLKHEDKIEWLQYRVRLRVKV